MNKKEAKKLKKFINKHGGVFTIIKTYTGIGTGYDVTCIQCGKKKDLTDYKTW